MTTETPQEIIAKVEGIARIVDDMGHLCVIRRWHDPALCMEFFQADAAHWLPDQECYGHTYHCREAITDQAVTSARDPQFLYADAAYTVLRAALSELGLWSAAEQIWRSEREKMRA